MPATPEDLTGTVLICMNPTFVWPTLAESGFPTIVVGGMASMLAGLGLVLPFIALDPEDLPDFTVPDIDVFITAMMGAAGGLPSFPETTLSISGLSVPLPAYSGIPSPTIPPLNGSPLPQFDPTTVVEMVGMFIAVPFLIIQEILDKILQLELFIPDAAFVIAIIAAAGADLGFTVPAIELFSACFATSLVTMITETLV